MGRVDGKVTVVTGAASGIGRAAARLLAAEGARLVLGDVDETGGEDVAREIREAGGTARFRRTDVRSFDDVGALVGSAVEEHGGLGAIVNNVGVAIGCAASKGGINALTQQAAVEYAPKGIRVNAIIPGTILTGMNEGILREHPQPDELMALWTSMHPIGRIGRPEEVATAIVYLASDEASFVTGMLLRVDGGMVVKAG